MAAKPKTTTATGLYVNGRCIECKTFKSKSHKDGCKYGKPVEGFTTCVQCQGVDGNHDLTCSLHPDHRRETSVDGKTSTVVHTNPPEPQQQKLLPAYPPIELIPGAIEALQKLYDSGEYGTFKPCEFQYGYQAEKHNCPHKGPIEVRKTVECEYGKHKKHLVRYCLLHGPNVLGANAPAFAQIELPL